MLVLATKPLSKTNFYFGAFPLSKQKEIPIPCDWVVSIVEPLDEVKQSYMEQVNDQNTSNAEQSDSDNAD